ncbi:MAG: hypothetical protein IJ842_06350 [Bacilli bacterium]|nr:hypothetical protein [Bacilli bacterium]
MLEKYYKYKMDFREYVVLIKFGNFYECFEKDAFILNVLFKYKVKKISNSFKVGFPISSLDNVIDKFHKEKINYVVVENDNVIKKSFDNNNYFNYKFDMEEMLYNYLRIEKIVKYFEDNIMVSGFSDKLKNIEEMLYVD